MNLLKSIIYAIIMIQMVGSPILAKNGKGIKNRPDLIIETLSHSPDNPKLWDTITVTVVVKNIGLAPSGPSILNLKIGGETYGKNFRICKIDSGQSFSVHRTAILNIAQNYRNTATADIKNRVAESNESNNQKTDDYTVTNTVTDTDGNTYKAVKIGVQWWLVENLRVTHYRNGEPINHVPDKDMWIDSSKTDGAYCYYDNNPQNATEYGCLYNWYALSDPRQITPEGWCIPSDDDWHILAKTLGDTDIAGGKLKESGTAHWDSTEINVTNQSGFSALPAGYRSDNNGNPSTISGYEEGAFYDLRKQTQFWSTIEYGGIQAWVWGLYDHHCKFVHGYNYKRCGFSIRCVRNVVH